jgi:putative membrane protein insertion efficiency factor
MIRKLFIGLIRAYQLFISPLLGPSCRFYPSCSEYAVEAIKIHGIFKGSFLAIHRVLRCHPGCDGGHDPVPEKCTKKKRVKNPPDHQTKSL